VLELAQAGRFAEISEPFAPPLRAMVPPEALQAAWAAENSRRGPARQIGTRDYQATVADDLARWRAGLAGRPDVTVHVYQADNHLFFPGSGPSAPAEYGPARHLNPAVVTDIAGWLASLAPDGPGRGP
jgi:hypothetical protein